jgi:hypothetical protein
MAAQVVRLVVGMEQGKGFFASGGMFGHGRPPLLFSYKNIPFCVQEATPTLFLKAKEFPNSGKK